MKKKKENQKSKRKDSFDLCYTAILWYEDWKLIRQNVLCVSGSDRLFTLPVGLSCRKDEIV